MIHIVTSRPFDLVKLAADVAADLSPTHVLLELARRVPVTFHMPGDSPFRLAFTRDTAPAAAPAEKRPTTDSRPALSALDRFRAKLISRPDLWALGRHAVAHTEPGDILFCTGEDIGIPLAAACAAKGQGMRRLIVTAHNLNRPRVNAAFRLFRTLRSVSTWVTPAASQATYLRSLGVPPSAIDITPEQTDHRFYTPGPASEKKTKPLLVAVGLERRDYRTLANATADMPVDVRISGFSTDARALSSAFPDPLPTNMTRKFYDWPSLRQLYRDADIVIVPLLHNHYVAGMTSLLEGHACQKPVIVSHTEGLTAYISDTRAVPVPPEDPAALKAAITALLASPEKAHTIADQGRRWLLQHHTPDHWVTALLDILYADIREPWRSMVHQTPASV